MENIQQMTAVNHRGPQQKRVLDGDVILLRKINPAVLGRPLHEALRGTQLGGGNKEGDQDWFLDNYLAADQPRDSNTTKAIIDATVGYAIARTDNGQIIASFNAKEGRRASIIADTARAELAVDIAMREHDDEVLDSATSDDVDAPASK